MSRRVFSTELAEKILAGLLFTAFCATLLSMITPLFL